MSKLFQPITFRNIECKNRIFLSPMCQYSAYDGMPQDWHMVHYGSRAVGGVGMAIVEATAVSPEGRISGGDLGIWSDEHGEALGRVAHIIKKHGAVSGIQLAHAGRKASCDLPWRGGGPLKPEAGGWQTLAPSALTFDKDDPKPREMTEKDIEHITFLFESAARLALSAGFQVAEIHMAHGYLLHEFLSPLSNHRHDIYGGSLENRARLPLMVARAVRGIWPSYLPVFVRISATDWVEGGWDLPQSVQLAKWLKEIGIDLIDCSSGGLTADANVPYGTGFQVPFAEAVRKEAGIFTSAVGFITEPQQAEEIVSCGSADAVMLGRELLRNPYWPLKAAEALGVDIPWKNQYVRAKPGF